MKPVSVWFAAALVAAAIPAARGAAPDADPDACALGAQLDFGGTLGIPNDTKLMRFREGALSICSFGSAPRVMAVVILRRLGEDGGWAAGEKARMRSGVAAGTYRALPDLGAPSFLYPMRTGAVVCVFGRGYYLQIAAFPGRGAGGVQEVLERLAARALDRLGGRSVADRLARLPRTDGADHR